MAEKIPDQMRAAQVVEHGKDLVIRQVPVPKPEYNQILVKIEASGVCHTDLHVQIGDWKHKCNVPLTPGHEGVGKVVQLGEGVENLKIGDRVCIPWLHKSCGCCDYCWGGNENVCENQLRTGFSVNGGFAEYCVADARFVGIVPDNVSNEQAAPITCAGVTVYKGLKVSEAKPGDTVAIVGAAGGLGHLAIQYAKAMGFKVIGIDNGPAKMDVIKSLGADFAIDVSKTKSVPDEVRKITKGKGVQGTLIVVPIAKAIGEAVSYSCPLGVVVCIALPPGTFQADVFDTIINGISIKGSIVGTRLDLKEALQLAADGKIKCKVEVKKFEEVNNVLKDLQNGKVTGRIVLKF